jgi:hypothetical protein
MKFLTAALIPAAITAAASALAPAQSAPSPRFLVSMTMFGENAPLVARLIADANSPATFRSGDGMQIFELTALPAGGNGFHLRGNLIQWTKHGLISDDTQTEAKADGLPRCITVMKTDPKTGKQVPMHIDVAIQPVR